MSPNFLVQNVKREYHTSNGMFADLGGTFAAILIICFLFLPCIAIYFWHFFQRNVALKSSHKLQMMELKDFLEQAPKLRSIIRREISSVSKEKSDIDDSSPITRIDVRTVVIKKMKELECDQKELSVEWKKSLINEVARVVRIQKQQ